MTRDHSRVTRGRFWAYLGVLLGGGVSIAANIAHSLLPPPGAGADWHTEPGAIVGAIVWPVFLFIAVEMLVRVAWPNRWGYKLFRFCGLLPVAGLAAFVSYRHLSGLLDHYGEERIVALVGPLAVDGLMLMATGALMAISHNNRTATTPAATPPITVTQPAAVPAAPVVSALATPTIPAPAPMPAPVPTPVPVAAAATVAEVPTPAEVAPRITPTRPTTAPTVSAPVPAPRTGPARPRANKAATRQAPGLNPPTTDSSVTASGPVQPSLPVVPPALVARARELAAEYEAEHGTPITPGQLAVRLKVHSDEAAQALAVLHLDTAQPPTRTTLNGQPMKANR